MVTARILVDWSTWVGYCKELAEVVGDILLVGTEVQRDTIDQVDNHWVVVVGWKSIEG